MNPPVMEWGYSSHRDGNELVIWTSVRISNGEEFHCISYSYETRNELREVLDERIARSVVDELFGYAPYAKYVYLSANALRIIFLSPEDTYGVDLGRKYDAAFVAETLASTIARAFGMIAEQRAKLVA